MKRTAIPLITGIVLFSLGNFFAYSEFRQQVTLFQRLGLDAVPEIGVIERFSILFGLFLIVVGGISLIRMGLEHRRKRANSNQDSPRF